MTGEAAKRLAAMLTASQRSDVVLLAQIIIAAGNVPELGTDSKESVHG